MSSFEVSASVDEHGLEMTSNAHLALYEFLLGQMIQKFEMNGHKTWRALACFLSL